MFSSYESVEIFDVFCSDALPENKKSFAIEVIIQSDYHSLKENEITEIEEKIILFVQQSLQAELRT